ncbi:hypothetical protein CPB85DRAFT_1252146 [Mucidula mucida]|nr:hypothetical protein CPB85DRAFT_1252146 [Mucidula mucida]
MLASSGIYAHFVSDACFGQTSTDKRAGNSATGPQGHWRLLDVARRCVSDGFFGVGIVLDSVFWDSIGWAGLEGVIWVTSTGPVNRLKGGQFIFNEFLVWFPFELSFTTQGKSMFFLAGTTLLRVLVILLLSDLVFTFRAILRDYLTFTLMILLSNEPTRSDSLDIADMLIGILFYVSWLSFAASLPAAVIVVTDSIMTNSQSLHVRTSKRRIQLDLGFTDVSSGSDDLWTLRTSFYVNYSPTLDVPSPRTSCFAGIYLGSANAALAFKVANDHHKVLVSLTRPFVHDFYGCLKDRLDSVATSAPGLHRRLNLACFACLSASTRTPASWPSVTSTWKVALSVFCFDYHGSCRVYWTIGCCPGPVSCMVNADLIEEVLMVLLWIGPCSCSSKKGVASKGASQRRRPLLPSYDNLVVLVLVWYFLLADSNKLVFACLRGTLIRETDIEDNDGALGSDLDCLKTSALTRFQHPYWTVLANLVILGSLAALFDGRRSYFGSEWTSSSVYESFHRFAMFASILLLSSFLLTTTTTHGDFLDILERLLRIFFDVLLAVSLRTFARRRYRPDPLWEVKSSNSLISMRTVPASIWRQISRILTVPDAVFNGVRRRGVDVPS